MFAALPRVLQILSYKQEVAGSSPALPTKIINKNAYFSRFVQITTHLLCIGFTFVLRFAI
jgi:hypothetical protein